MAEQASPVWWVELIKISPGLITAGLAVGLVVAYRKELGALIRHMTKFKALGIEAEFDARVMDNAIAAQGVLVSSDDKTGALKRLQFVSPLLRDTRILWVDDTPSTTRNERALLEYCGARVTSVTTSIAAENELRDNVFAMVITDLKREGKETEGLEFVNRTVAAETYRWTIAYVGTDQEGKPRPANLFAITNRPDHLIHYVCDIIERERL